MKSRVIFSSILLMLAFAGESHAQHVKVFDGSSGVLLSRTGTPTAAAFAGQTVRLRIGAVNNRSRDVNDIYIFQSPASVVHGAVPCSKDQPTGTGSTGLGAGKANWSYNETAREYSFTLSTDKAWKGTCRLVVVKLRDGTEYRARLRFHRRDR